MNWMKSVGLLAVALLLSACASKPQLPVPLDAAMLGSSAGKVGVVMTELPKIDTAFPGAGCLLCLGVANMNHSALNKHVATWTHEDLPSIKQQVADLVGKKGSAAVVLAEPLKLDQLPSFSSEAANMAKLDFRGLAQKHGVDKLIVVQINALGVWRDYSAYVPVAPPRAVFKGVAYMVNLRSNQLEWFAPIDINKGSEAWDQAPSFPDLTNAYYQALELGKDAVLKPLQ